ncbi:MAG: prepilin-type N-terminal cleavage/methylation domain-containing protein [Candidatus Pacebacteria bacterium]|nr:prepilin-type N-terminal cleavage/methylation domain-containing protein [Candidatus Paceibacterota bacterium]
MKKYRAFTLIELLVVIAIVGILSGLIIVGMSGATEKARIAKSQVFSNSLRNSLLLNLFSEWKFDEGSGTTTADSWRTATGTLVGATHLPVWKTSADCIFNNCLQFDGTEDYVNVGVVGVSGDYSIDAWIKVETAGAGATRSLISFNGNSFPRFLVILGANQKPIIYLNNSNYRYGSTNAADGKWHHWYFGITGSGQADISTAKIYVDGKEETYGSTLANDSPTQPTGNVYIGSQAYSSIDNVRIYDSIISSSNIEAIYYCGLNRLLAKGEINAFDYQNRLAELSINSAQN